MQNEQNRPALVKPVTLPGSRAESLALLEELLAAGQRNELIQFVVLSQHSGGTWEVRASDLSDVTAVGARLMAAAVNLLGGPVGE